MRGKGNVRWMAPELIEGLEAKTRRTDVFAFGCLALEVRQSCGGELVRLELLLGFGPFGSSGTVVPQHVPYRIYADDTGDG